MPVEHQTQIELKWLDWVEVAFNAWTNQIILFTFWWRSMLVWWWWWWWSWTGHDLLAEMVNRSKRSTKWHSRFQIGHELNHPENSEKILSAPDHDYLFSNSKVTSEFEKKKQAVSGHKMRVELHVGFWQEPNRGTVVPTIEKVIFSNCW